MFEGRNFRVRHLSKNRFEYRSQYSLKQGTANEIMGLLADEQTAAQRNAIELTLAKKRLREAAEEDGADCSGPIPSIPPSPEPVVPPPEPEPAESEAQESPVAAAAPKTRRIVEPHVTMVSLRSSSDGRPRRRPNGLSYLTALREAEAAEKTE